MYRVNNFKDICKKCISKYSTRSHNDEIKNLLSNENKKRCIERSEKFANVYPDILKKSLCQTAAVLVPLCEVNGEPSLLFTVRSSDLRKGKGQVSFPGGGVDANDRSFTETALRETEEEIGFPKHEVDIWTDLPPYPDGTKTIAVHAVLGNLGKIDIERLKPNENEVAHVFTAPIHFLCNSDNTRTTKFRFQSRKVSAWDYTMPVYLTEPKIWGLTAVLVDLTLSCLFDKHEYLSDVHKKRGIRRENR